MQKTAENWNILALMIGSGGMRIYVAKSYIMRRDKNSCYSFVCFSLLQLQIRKNNSAFQLRFKSPAFNSDSNPPFPLMLFYLAAATPDAWAKISSMLHISLKLVTCALCYFKFTWFDNNFSTHSINQKLPEGALNVQHFNIIQNQAHFIRARHKI